MRFKPRWLFVLAIVAVTSPANALPYEPQFHADLAYLQDEQTGEISGIVSENGIIKNDIVQPPQGTNADDLTILLGIFRDAPLRDQLRNGLDRADGGPGVISWLVKATHYMSPDGSALSTENLRKSLFDELGTNVPGAEGKLIELRDHLDIIIKTIEEEVGWPWTWNYIPHVLALFGREDADFHTKLTGLRDSIQGTIDLIDQNNINAAQSKLDEVKSKLDATLAKLTTLPPSLLEKFGLTGEVTLGETQPLHKK